MAAITQGSTISSWWAEQKDGLSGCFTGFNFNHSLPMYDHNLLCISAKHTSRSQFKIQMWNKKVRK